MPYIKPDKPFFTGASYVGRVSKWGSRKIEVNGSEVMQFTLYLPSAVSDIAGHSTFTVRVSAYGVDVGPGPNDYVRVTGKPSTKPDKAGGVWNNIMCYGEQSIEVLSKFVPKERK
jgi:hypothetical protein